MRDRKPIATLAIIALAGTAMVTALTRFGPGTAGDSTSYLMGAENLLKGDGFSRYSGGYEIRPITGFPPGYSVALALASLVGSSLVEAGRWLNVLIFASNILLVGGMVYLVTRSLVAGALAELIFLSRATQLELHAWIMSEPLFILLSLIGVWLIALYIGRQRLGWLLAAAVVVALATLTRYVGAALIGAGAMAVLVFGPRGIGRRLGEAIIYAVVSGSPVYLWLLRNRELGGTMVNRELSYHGVDPALARLFFADISSWFMPHELPLPTSLRAGLAVLFVAGVLAAAAWKLARVWVRRDRARLELTGPDTGLASGLAAVPWILTIYTAGNLFIVWANSALLDAATTAAAPPRYLAPVFASTLVLFCIVVPMLVRSYGLTGAARSLLVAYGLVLLGFYASNSLAMVRDPLPHLGYTGRSLLWPDLVAHLSQVSDSDPIVSNNPEMIYILTGRPAYVRPISFDPYREELREDYARQFAQFENQMASGGLFVVFDEIEADDQQAIDRLSLQLLAEFPAARIYGRAEASAWDGGLGRI